MKPRCCHYCGQPLPETRLGVKLTPLKARIFDFVQRAGGAGILGEDLYWLIAEKEDGGRRKRETLKVHVHQINEAIEDSGYRIIGTRGSNYSSYRLVHRDPIMEERRVIIAQARRTAAKARDSRTSAGKP